MFYKLEYSLEDKYFFLVVVVVLEACLTWSKLSWLICGLCAYFWLISESSGASSVPILVILLTCSYNSVSQVLKRKELPVLKHLTAWLAVTFILQ